MSDMISDEEDDFLSDASGRSSQSGTRLTARQRAKEMGGEFGMELQSLSNGACSPLLSFSRAKVADATVGAEVQHKNKNDVKMTEAEVALKRAENLRKRRHQADKKLEDEVRLLCLSSLFRSTRLVRSLPLQTENGNHQSTAQKTSHKKEQET